MATDDAIAQAIQKLTVVVDAHAVDAILLGGRVIQLTVVGSMLASTVCFFIGAYCFIRAIWICRNSKEDEPPPMFWVHAVPGSFLGLIGGGAFIAYVLNPLYWAILYDARLAVAAKVLGLI